MSKSLFQTLQILSLVVLTTSCSVMGLNFKRKTPSRPSKYPQFTQADSLKGNLSKYRRSYDVTFYNISVEIDIKKEYLKGWVDMYFTSGENLDTIQIDLASNLFIDKILFKSDTLKFYRVHDAVFVIFNNSIEMGEQESISVYFQGKPDEAPKPPWEGGFVWRKDKDKNPWIGVACELKGASSWWPVKDHLTDEPDSLQINVTIPEGLFCVSNGRLINRSRQYGKETFSWRTEYPINSYNTTLYIGNFKHFSLPYEKTDTTYNLDFYVLPYNLEKAKEHFKQAVDILHFFEQQFGEYPWWDEGYKLVESPYAGMEHQTAIAYGDGYKNRFHDFDYIILHETAHEWWGNSVTATDYAEIWLHEGFATYSEALYVEYTEGYDSYLNYLGVYSVLIKNKKPLIGPYDVNYWDYKDGDVYTKGALLLHTLRNSIANDSIFFDIIKSFYNENKYGTTTTTNFIELVREKTGTDYTWFFNHYLYKRSCPQLQWRYEYNSSMGYYQIWYKWLNVGDDFKLPVTIKTDDGEVIIYPKKQAQYYKFSSGGTVYLNTNNSYISLLKD